MRIILFLTFIFIFNFAHTKENEKIIFLDPSPALTSALTSTTTPLTIPLITPLNSDEIFRRTQAVLNYFHVPTEENSDNYFSDLKNIRSFNEIQQILNWMDPTHFFKTLSQITSTSLTVYQDFNSKKILDLSLQIRPSTNTHLDLKQPLKGLRIALDPGHMGNHYWDLQTGKFVHNDKGHVISEGLLNLQTCLLLKAEFEKLGALVFLTHDDLKPVSSIDYATFDLKPYALKELRDSIHKDWFLNLVSAPSATDTDLFKNFENNATVKKMFSENYRSEYFIKREDLWTRAHLMDQFQPDLILIIHYDTADPTVGDTSALNPKAPLQTKAFVVGSYEKTEFGSRESRKYFVRHLLDKTSWENSLSLSRSIVGQLHKQLNLSLALSADTGSTEIEPGVFSRNLMVSRRIKTSAAMTYLECLFYDRPEEFQLLSQNNYSMMIGGNNVPYSERLQHIVNAIKDGVINYVNENSN